MSATRSRVLTLAVLVALSACSGSDRAPAADATAAAPAPAAAGGDAPAAEDARTGDPGATGSTPGGGTDGMRDKGGEPVPLVAFDPASVPPAANAPGALPVFSLPRGYAVTEGPQVRTFARFPFRLGNGVHWVEGPSWSSRISVDDDAFPDKDYSSLEVRRNIEAVLQQAGATRVYDGLLQRDIYYGSVEDEIGSGFIDVVNHEVDTPTSVFVIRHGDRTVWIQAVYDTQAAGVVAMESRPFQATSRWSDDFPHLALPAGYERRNTPLQRDFDAFPFWTGTAFEEVEGKAYAVDFAADEDANSMHEVRRNLEAMMEEAGGVLVHAGPVPRDQSDAIPFERKSPYGNAASYNWTEGERSTWRVDLDGGRQVWVHARLDPRSAGWVVLERTGFVQTAALLPADALKNQIEASGRVAIQVNFAVDKAEILPESRPQLEQVVALLKDDRGLRLSVDGHTDASGDAARNRTLSEARARSVVAVLVASGIAADRLQARGHGADKPVADNGSEDGKAKNRRVELVKL
ncbi:MAG TPA: OmpA family protein [Luteimonas sp.]|nr:OmpA family protein [Luteimonas sp.]